MTVRLRPHHLLCMLTYAGRGYSAAFTANLDAVTERLRSEDILIVAGPDDICAPLLTGPEVEDAHCLAARVEARDSAAARAVASLLHRPVSSGERLMIGQTERERLRAAFKAGTSRAACTGCNWATFCSEIAASDFAGTRLV
ncbi:MULTISPECIES: DUF1284 domain-containing protein [unclassified Chelatococcus]|uniref:DUF1284 domain-containing protein n=1 Tax=unclassified Chelatococcus TaxID=2638111 RepID=UPI001BCD7675|nr:DUF1284 domain-containing protein [Chelatococcus sp.]MBS7739571.1 DUF1284 domain-containing protein [Chelatococcus sp. HY11]CAH1649171.1 conserved hypothetical protein [Hyphomicrobiales bacterium]MBX3543940.1 DUF1284 domain-containing protein [Chelatococcus sp.]MCO5075892.1 DUF1284 domain-containing protein [Chelatococcus sp.]CAH1667574.1 conserved hypothetical protein [Hyphomicrobiales bacterium]